MGRIQDAYTLSQAIKYHGKEFSVKRPVLNKFKEPAGEEPVGSFRGLFHASSGYLDISLTEAAKVSTRRQPQLLLLYTNKIHKEDRVILGGKTYTVTGVDDVGNRQLCTELSLREEG